MADFTRLIADLRAFEGKRDDHGVANEADAWMDEAADAIESLQTENTELREHKDALIAEWSGKAADRLAKLTAVERVITETLAALAVPPDDSENSEEPEKWYVILSSYPLGEGQTQQGDER